VNEEMKDEKDLPRRTYLRQMGALGALTALGYGAASYLASKPVEVSALSSGFTVDPADVELIKTTVDGMASEIPEFLSELIQINSTTPTYGGADPSVRGGELDVCNHIGAKLATFPVPPTVTDIYEGGGFTGRGNLVATFPGTGGGRSLLIWGHNDVVPEGNPADWTPYPPFSGTIADGKVWGRGASDDKGGLNPGLFAIKAIQEAGLTLNGNLYYGATCGEETGDGGAEGCLERAGAITMMDRGYMADAGINLDGGGTATITQVHLLWMKVVVPGFSAHSSQRGTMLTKEMKHEYPTGPVSAIDKASIIMDALRKLETKWRATKKFYLLPQGHYTIGPNVLRGGPDGITTPYIIPNHCDIDYCVWALQTESVDQAKNELLAAINGAAAGDWWLMDHPPTVTWELWWPPFFTPEDHPIVVNVQDAAEVITGTRPAIASSGAVTDSCFVLPIPAVNYTGKTGYGAHSLNEYANIASQISATKTLALAILNWCGYTK